MKYCQYCGSQLEDDARFCSKCGLEHGEAKKEDPVQVDPVIVDPIDLNATPPMPDSQIPQQETYTGFQETPPNNGLVWLILSIVMTLCCCNVLQVVTIVFAAISMSRHNQGDYEEAKRYSKIAMIIFFSLLALSIIASIVMYAVTGSLTPEFFNEIYEQYY